MENHPNMKNFVNYRGKKLVVCGHILIISRRFKSDVGKILVLTIRG